MRAGVCERLVCVLFAAAGAACSKSPDSATSRPAGEALNVYMFSEYIDPAIPAEFERQTGTRVRVSVYEATEEMIAKLQQAGGAEQFDVVVASDHAVPVLVKLGLIQALDAEKVPNRANLSGRFRDPAYDPGNRHSLPYQWGTVGLMYRKDRVRDFEPSWAMVFEPGRSPGPFVLIDSMRDMLAAALKYDGRSVNSRDASEVKSAGERVLRAKKQAACLGFEGGVGGKNKVVSNEAAVAIVYNGDAVRAAEEEPNVAFAVPKEGTVMWVDVMTLSARARHVEAAHRFINYILDPQVGAKLSNFNRYATPNEAALPLIRAEDRSNPAIYPSEELMKKMEYLEDLGGDTRLYDEVWTAVKAG